MTDLITIFGLLGWIGWAVLILVGVVIWKIKRTQKNMVAGLMGIVEELNKGPQQNKEKQDKEIEKRAEDTRGTWDQIFNNEKDDSND
jgi:hypothetical protein